MTYRSNDVARYFKSTKHKVAPRVYWFLSVMQDDGARFTTLDEIATMINTNRHSVSRALRLLRNMGIVSYHRGKHGIFIDRVNTSI